MSLSDGLLQSIAAVVETRHIHTAIGSENHSSLGATLHGITAANQNVGEVSGVFHAEGFAVETELLFLEIDGGVLHRDPRFRLAGTTFNAYIGM